MDFIHEQDKKSVVVGTGENGRIRREAFDGERLQSQALGRTATDFPGLDGFPPFPGAEENRFEWPRAAIPGFEVSGAAFPQADS